MSYTVTRRGRRRRTVQPLVVPLGFVALALLPDLFGGLTMLPVFSSWYVHSPHPAWALPGWVYATVWPIAHVLSGVAAYLVWLGGVQPLRSFLWGAVITQLVLQCVWPVAFLGQVLVGGTALWLVFGIIVLLDLVTLAVLVAFWPISRVAAVLMALVLAWLLLGTALSFGETVLITLGR